MLAPVRSFFILIFLTISIGFSYGLSIFFSRFMLRCMFYQDKKEEIWLSPMTKAPSPTKMSKGQSENTNNATKKFD